MNPHKRPVPADFFEVAPTMTKRDLIKHYNVGWSCFERWIAETGIETSKERKPSTKGGQIPETFAKDAKTMTDVALSRKYGGASSKMRRWRAKLGLGNARSTVSKGRPIPHDFLKMFDRLGTIVALVKHYEASEKTVRRWVKQMDLKLIPQKRLLPDDFHRLAPNMTRQQCMDRWHCSESMLSRWVKDSGVTLRSMRRASRATIAREHAQFTSLMRDQRPDTPATRAAETLQRNRWPTYRCNERGAYDPKGTHWRVGNLVLTEDQLLERAAKYERLVA